MTPPVETLSVQVVPSHQRSSKRPKGSAAHIAGGALVGGGGSCWGVGAGSGKLLMPAQALAGLMESKSGKVYAFGLYMNGGTFDSPADIIKVLDDVAGVAADIQQSL